MSFALGKIGTFGGTSETGRRFSLFRRSFSRGIALFSAVLLLLVIAILATAFHKMALEAQYSTFRFFTAETARQLAESALEEAFAYVYTETADETTDLSTKIIKNSRSSAGFLDCTTGPLSAKNDKGITIEVPQIIAVAKKQPWGAKFDIKVSARLIDFRSVDYEGNPFYDCEGVGTIELRSAVTPKEEFQRVIKAGFAITRHHDYRVVSLISKKDQRPPHYVHNSLLDYVLFIKNGRQEFQESFGSNLNIEGKRLVIDQTGPSAPKSPEVYGKIFLGGTSGPGGKPVFIDLATDTADLLPEPRYQTPLVPPSPINSADCHDLIPNMARSINESQKAAFEKEYGNGKATFISGELRGIKGVFSFIRFPCLSDQSSPMGSNPADELPKPFGLIPYEERWNTLCRLWGAGDAKDLVPLNINLPYSPLDIRPKEHLENILQGKIRKRFFHYGFFQIDYSDSKLCILYKHPSIGEKAEYRKYEDFKKDLKDTEKVRFPCLPVSCNKPDLPSPIDFSVLESRFSQPHVISALNSEFDYLPGAKKDSLPQPEFYSSIDHKKLLTTALDPVLPFSHVNLWNRNGGFPASALSRFKILHDGVLNLRGIVRIQGQVVLKGKGNSPLLVYGKGALIADEIIIESGIKKGTPDALCILGTRGYPVNKKFSRIISVNTNDRVEAALVALGKSGGGAVVVRNHTLNLFGALLVDKLDINTWKKGVSHTVAYDPALAPTENLYQINISRWVSFSRIQENDES
jgi:Tfp pilus assembly protein PilX